MFHFVQVGILSRTGSQLLSGFPVHSLGQQSLWCERPMSNPPSAKTDAQAAQSPGSCAMLSPSCAVIEMMVWFQKRSLRDTCSKSDSGDWDRLMGRVMEAEKVHVLAHIYKIWTWDSLRHNKQPALWTSLVKLPYFISSNSWGQSKCGSPASCLMQPMQYHFSSAALGTVPTPLGILPFHLIPLAFVANASQGKLLVFHLIKHFA